MERIQAGRSQLHPLRDRVIHPVKHEEDVHKKAEIPTPGTHIQQQRSAESCLIWYVKTHYLNVPRVSFPSPVRVVRMDDIGRWSCKITAFDQDHTYQARANKEAVLKLQVSITFRKSSNQEMIIFLFIISQSENLSSC
jgi:hypothetical protein